MIVTERWKYELWLSSNINKWKFRYQLIQMMLLYHKSNKSAIILFENNIISLAKFY